MSKVYTCRIAGAYRDVDVTVDTATGDRNGETLSCWLPSAGETDADARPVTFGAAGVDPEPAPAEPAASTTPTGQDVADFVGEGSDVTTVDRAAKLLPFVIETVRGYTRGQGFTPDGVPADDVALVIVASAARLVTNPTLDEFEGVGGYSHRPGRFDGWTLPELAILNRYRRRAQ